MGRSFEFIRSQWVYENPTLNRACICPHLEETTAGQRSLGQMALKYQASHNHLRLCLVSYEVELRGVNQTTFNGIDDVLDHEICYRPVIAVS
jgi:hypothetical protein